MLVSQIPSMSTTIDSRRSQSAILRSFQLCCLLFVMGVINRRECRIEVRFQSVESHKGERRRTYDRMTMRRDASARAVKEKNYVCG